MVYHLWGLLTKLLDILVSKYGLGGLGNCWWLCPTFSKKAMQSLSIIQRWFRAGGKCLTYELTKGCINKKRLTCEANYQQCQENTHVRAHARASCLQLYEQDEQAKIWKRTCWWRNKSQTWIALRRALSVSLLCRGWRNPWFRFLFSCFYFFTAFWKLTLLTWGDRSSISAMLCVLGFRSPRLHIRRFLSVLRAHMCPLSETVHALSEVFFSSTWKPLPPLLPFMTLVHL